MTEKQLRSVVLHCLLSGIVVCSSATAQQFSPPTPRNSSRLRPIQHVPRLQGQLQQGASSTYSEVPTPRLPYDSSQSATRSGFGLTVKSGANANGQAARTRPNDNLAWSTESSNHVDTHVQPATAVEDAEKTVSVSQAEIDAQIKKINAATDLDEEEKKEALDRLTGATDWLKTAADAEAKTNEYRADSDSAPIDIKNAKDSLAVPAGEPDFDIPKDATSSQIEQKASDVDTKLKVARETLAKREESLKRRGDRKAELTKLISEIDEKLEDARKQVETDPVESSLVGAARQIENEARYVALKMQKELYPIELKRLDARTELLPLLRDVAKREVAYLEKEAAGWQKIAADVRKRESDRQAAEARQQVQNAHPALKSFAEKNAKLAEQRKAMIAAIEKIETVIQQNERVANQLKGDFDRIQEKVEKAGQSTATGFLLRRQRDHLPDLSDGRDRIRFVRQVTPRIHLSALDLQDARDSLGDLDTAVAGVMSQLAGTVRQSDRQYISQMVVDLLQTKTRRTRQPAPRSRPIHHVAWGIGTFAKGVTGPKRSLRQLHRRARLVDTKQRTDRPGGGCHRHDGFELAYPTSEVVGHCASHSIACVGAALVGLVRHRYGCLSDALSRPPPSTNPPQLCVGRHCPSPSFLAHR